MINKKCKKCGIIKKISEFYKHPEMLDGTVNKCKECSKIDNRPSNGKIERNCFICNKIFKTNISEIKNGGGITCSRDCYYKRLRLIIKKEEESPSWKGDKVGNAALHDWVKRHKGKPQECEHCHSTKAKKYEWANKSQKYKRDLNDWIRLCTKCHAKYDYSVRNKKWKKSVKKLGWNVA